MPARGAGGERSASSVSPIVNTQEWTGFRDMLQTLLIGRAWSELFDLGQFLAVMCVCGHSVDCSRCGRCAQLLCLPGPTLFKSDLVHLLVDVSVFQRSSDKRALLLNIFRMPLSGRAC